MVLHYYFLTAILFITSGFCSCNNPVHELDTLLSSTETMTTSARRQDTLMLDSLRLDTALYDFLQMHLVHNSPSDKWPVQAGYPNYGAVLPFKRIVAFYGNFYSKGMGILGELPGDEMLEKLQQEVSRWRLADSVIPVQPALHYIAVTAQRNPGADGKYRARMPFSQIEKALELAAKINGLVFLDLQVGHSSLQSELPLLEKYWSMPNVHIGIDPEFSMKGKQVPGSTIGTFDATDVNFAVDYLAQILREKGLPPKILVVHRFNKGMLTNYRNIVRRPEVQIVINMDGFGFPAKKVNSYKWAVGYEPVQFTGFKIFYRNDRLNHPFRLMTPAEILDLYPSPIYIQYQ